MYPSYCIFYLFSGRSETARGVYKPNSRKVYDVDGISMFFFFFRIISSVFRRRRRRREEQIVFSHNISQRPDLHRSPGVPVPMNRGVWVRGPRELDYTVGSEIRVSRYVECQLRKQESPRGPEEDADPIIHFSRLFPLFFPYFFPIFFFFFYLYSPPLPASATAFGNNRNTTPPGRVTAVGPRTFRPT